MENDGEYNLLIDVFGRGGGGWVLSSMMAAYGLKVEIVIMGLSWVYEMTEYR